ncbi:MAG: DUF488 family protein [Anaerolineae bacterium]
MESEQNPIFTLGSSTRSAQEFLDLLAHYQVEAIVDVRRFPTSRFEHFIKEKLALLLEENGIAYLYLGEELGGYRSGGYEAYMKSEEFEAGLVRLQSLAQKKRVAIMCSERLPWRCHRRHIGRALRERGWELQHLIDLDRVWIPKERK